MEIQVALQYPNGRIHQTVYDTTRPIERGTEFDMHGRRWRVVGRVGKPHRPNSPKLPARVLCVATDA